MLASAQAKDFCHQVDPSDAFGHPGAEQARGEYYSHSIDANEIRTKHVFTEFFVRLHVDEFGRIQRDMMHPRPRRDRLLHTPNCLIHREEVDRNAKKICAHRMKPPQLITAASSIYHETDVGTQKDIE